MSSSQSSSIIHPSTCRGRLGWNLERGAGGCCHLSAYTKNWDRYFIPANIGLSVRAIQDCFEPAPDGSADYSDLGSLTDGDGVVVVDALGLVLRQGVEGVSLLNSHRESAKNVRHLPQSEVVEGLLPGASLCFLDATYKSLRTACLWLP